MIDDPDFARLVSLACHDLRTPLATVHGFARTLAGGGGLESPNDRYVEMIDAASDQLRELLDELSLAAARIASRSPAGALKSRPTLPISSAESPRSRNPRSATEASTRS